MEGLEGGTVDMVGDIESIHGEDAAHSSGTHGWVLERTGC